MKSTLQSAVSNIDRRTTGLFFSGLVIGALGTFFLDPISGRRRRTSLRDKGFSLRNTISSYAGKHGRGLRNRAQEIQAMLSQTRKPLASTEEVDDRVLIERVRSEFGRSASHSSAIDVDARDGVVTLRGPILADEVQEIISCAKKVRGVTGVLNEMIAHQTPPSSSSLDSQKRQHLQH